MTSDRDIWAIAANVLEAHGNNVGTYLLGRVEEMNQAGNDAGLSMWLAVSDHVSRLLQAPEDPGDLN